MWFLLERTGCVSRWTCRPHTQHTHTLLCFKFNLRGNKYTEEKVSTKRQKQKKKVSSPAEMFTNVRLSWKCRRCESCGGKPSETPEVKKKPFSGSFRFLRACLQPAYTCRTSCLPDTGEEDFLRKTTTGKEKTRINKNAHWLDYFFLLVTTYFCVLDTISTSYNLIKIPKTFYMYSYLAYKCFIQSNINKMRVSRHLC